MKLLHYITIQPSDTLEDVLSKIRRYIRESQFVIIEKPLNLSGNQKVLKLVSRVNYTDFVKIDGPGFMIDKLFDYFTTR